MWTILGSLHLFENVSEEMLPTSCGRFLLSSMIAKLGCSVLWTLGLQQNSEDLTSVVHGFVQAIELGLHDGKARLFGSVASYRVFTVLFFHFSCSSGFAFPFGLCLHDGDVGMLKPDVD